jgi:malate/lactate dehydrogenase
MDKKATVVGAGHVGATAAQRLAEKELCDVVLIDIIKGMILISSEPMSMMLQPIRTLSLLRQAYPVNPA